MLIPVYGMNGAAWAAVAGYAAQLLTTLPFCFKSRAK
jgi:Na+-driven multidrug efflux pump